MISNQEVASIAFSTGQGGRPACVLAFLADEAPINRQASKRDSSTTDGAVTGDQPSSLAGETSVTIVSIEGALNLGDTFNSLVETGNTTFVMVVGPLMP